MLKVALVGVGGISTAHINAWKRIEGAELVAICDIRPEQMEKYPEQRRYTDFDQMLKNEKIDILDICLPTYLHTEFAIKALNKKINVLCEKPISLKKGDVNKIYTAAKKNNVKFMVAQVLRFWPEYSVIKKVFDEGTYGKLLSGSMNRLGGFPFWSWDGWMKDEKRSGGVTFDLHIHDLDFIVYAFGSPKKISTNRSKMPDQDYLSARYDFGDFFINAQAAWYASPYPFNSEFLFQFENAIIAKENGKLTVYEKGGETYCPISDSAADNGNIGLPASDAYFEEIKYFFNCVKTKQPAEIIKPKELKTVIKLLKRI